jgi:hypothetical protein
MKKSKNIEVILAHHHILCGFEGRKRQGGWVVLLLASAPTDLKVLVAFCELSLAPLFPHDLYPNGAIHFSCHEGLSSYFNNFQDSDWRIIYCDP